MPQQILGTTVQKTDDAVGIFRNDQEKKHWYVAVVNNRSEKACQDRLRKRLKNETDSEKAYEVYVPIQQEMSIRHDGKRKKVDRIVSVSYTHLTLPTNHDMCRSRWSPYH